MKNAGIMLKNWITLTLCMIAGIFVFSCGLEEVLIVPDPTVTYNNPLYSSDDSLTWYFSFKTVSDSDKNFIGTDVYYKIYNDYNKLISERSSILSVNTSSNSSAAATKMVETYNYQTLGSSQNSGNAVYFPNTTPQTVVIRLKTYVNADPSSEGAQDQYKSHACVGVKAEGKTLYTYKQYIPYRNGNRKSFDFFDDNDDDKNRVRDCLPVYGDSDYCCNESDKSTSFEEYYVQMFAVGVAFNQEKVSSEYSLVLDLGSVPIKKNE